MAAPLAFSGSIPEVYERHLVPLMFRPFALDTAERVAKSGKHNHVLEIACGTGVVTQALRDKLPKQSCIVATDLEASMLAHAQAVHPDLASVEWRQADAMKLPFPNATFDHVVCQFGIMFFPDKVVALKEMHRVLQPGGDLIVYVWDSPEFVRPSKFEDVKTHFRQNYCAAAVQRVLTAFFPVDTPPWINVPFGYTDHAKIKSDFVAGGFKDPAIVITKAQAHAPSAAFAAEGLVNGAPLRTALMQRKPEVLQPLLQALADDLGKGFNGGPISLPMQCIVIQCSRE